MSLAKVKTVIVLAIVKEENPLITIVVEEVCEQCVKDWPVLER